MKFMLKIIIQHKKFEWVKDAYSFEQAILIAENIQRKFGLIGRTYITSSCGKQTWIR
jgi:hypothetical protein